MRGYIFLGILFLWMPLSNAASFDCSKAGSPFEKTICANPSLSGLDDKLAQLYSAARASTTNPDQLKVEQIDWIKKARTCGTDMGCIENSYKARISALTPQQSAPKTQPTSPQVATTPLVTPAQQVQSPVSPVLAPIVSGPQPIQGASRPAPAVNRSKLVTGVEYKWWPIVNTGVVYNSEKTIYLSPADYEYFCKNSKGYTKNVTPTLTLMSNKAKFLLENGSIERIKTFWAPNANRQYLCRVELTLTGIVKGSSSREIVEGGVETFLVSKDGEILVHYADSMKY